MFTARKMVSACAGVALLADRWPEWLVVRDRIFLTAPSPSFREACLRALCEIGLAEAAGELRAIETDNEVARSAGFLAVVDELA